MTFYIKIIKNQSLGKNFSEINKGLFGFESKKIYFRKIKLSQFWLSSWFYNR